MRAEQKVRDEIVRQAGVDACDQVTAEHLANIERLLIPEGGTVPLNAGDFAGMSGLTKLWLGENGLGSLPDGVFQGLTNLITLDLSENGLGSCPTVFSRG